MDRAAPPTPQPEDTRQTKVTSSIDTAPTLSVTTLALARYRRKNMVAAPGGHAVSQNDLEICLASMQDQSTL